jgi:hypothetical protein
MSVKNRRSGTSLNGGFAFVSLYVQSIRQSEKGKQEIKVSVQRCLQRVALTDTHGAPYFFRYDNSAEIVDPADNSCCFHIYDLRCFFKIAVILFAEVGNLCRKKSELVRLAFFDMYC